MLLIRSEAITENKNKKAAVGRKEAQSSTPGGFLNEAKLVDCGVKRRDPNYRSWSPAERQIPHHRLLES